MNVARDPRKLPPGMRCYNCNEFGHLARDCRKPPRRPASTDQTRGRYRTKSLHLLEDVDEGDDEYHGDEEPDAEGEYDPEVFRLNDTEYDPQQPDE